jgi:hypothetical protein
LRGGNVHHDGGFVAVPIRVNAADDVGFALVVDEQLQVVADFVSQARAHINAVGARQFAHSLLAIWRRVCFEILGCCDLTPLLRLSRRAAPKRRQTAALASGIRAHGVCLDGVCVDRVCIDKVAAFGD